MRISFLSERHYYARGVNLALSQVETPYVALVNDDVRLQPNWVEAALEGLDRHPEHGSLASRVVSLRDRSMLDSCGDSLYLCGRATANGWREPVERWTKPDEVFSASGCLATYRVADLRRAGCLDEAFIAYMEDVDLGFRLQLLGRPCIFWPQAEAAHYGGATRKTPRRAAGLAERNAMLVAIKNLPRELLLDGLREILGEHASPCTFEDYRSWSAWFTGKSSALRLVPAAVRKRREVQASRAVSTGYVRSILKPGSPVACHL